VETLPAEVEAQIARLHESLRGWALGDVQRAFNGGAKVGAFILAAHLIDTLALLTHAKGQGSDAWTQLIGRYLTRYTGSAKLLEDGLRNATSHNYSTRGLRLVDGADYAGRHWTTEAGDRVLHLETFLDELERAYDAFEKDLRNDASLRQCVLDRARLNPPLGIVHEPSSASVGRSSTIAQVVGATSYSGAHAATGAWWPSEPKFQLDPPAPVPEPHKSKRPRSKKPK
jgi:hypothetical protein